MTTKMKQRIDDLIVPACLTGVACFQLAGVHSSVLQYVCSSTIAAVLLLEAMWWVAKIQRTAAGKE